MKKGKENMETAKKQQMEKKMGKKKGKALPPWLAKKGKK